VTDARTIFDGILADPNSRGRVAHVREIEAREARYAEPASPLTPPIARALAARGIRALYTHQAQAIDAAREGRSILVTTRTSSGKTLCYNVPVLERLVAEPSARALYLYPSKALAQDQMDGLRSLDLPVTLVLGGLLNASRSAAAPLGSPAVRRAARDARPEANS
jgi:DEAD/DEAH box helicase domain-containing protein